MQRLYLEMGRAVWRNPRVSPSDNTNESVMGGLNWFIGENGQAASGAFSHANISAFVYDLFEMGLLSPEIWINPYDADVYRQLDSTYIQVDAKVTFAGRPLPSLLYTTRGQEVSIKIDPQCPQGQHFVIDPSYLSVNPLAGEIDTAVADIESEIRAAEGITHKLKDNHRRSEGTLERLERVNQRFRELLAEGDCEK